MKKIALILAALLLVSSLVACNDTEVEENEYGGISSYTSTVRTHEVKVNDEVIATFTYVDGSGDSAIITGYTGPVEPHEVVIPEIVGTGDAALKVKAIGAEAFYYRTAITAITLPSTLEKIESMAFAGCTNIEKITIPASVQSIGNYAFANCYALTSVTVENNSKLESIGDFAFNECGCLKSINIPESLKHIGKGSFRMCADLESIKTPAGLLSIDDMPFVGCTKLNTPGAIDVSASVNIEYIYVEKDGDHVYEANLGNNIFSGIDPYNIIAPEEKESDLYIYIDNLKKVAESN